MYKPLVCDGMGNILNALVGHVCGLEAGNSSFHPGQEEGGLT